MCVHILSAASIYFKVVLVTWILWLLEGKALALWPHSYMSRCESTWKDKSKTSEECAGGSPLNSSSKITETRENIYLFLACVGADPAVLCRRFLSYLIIYSACKWCFLHFYKKSTGWCGWTMFSFVDGESFSWTFGDLIFVWGII